MPTLAQLLTGRPVLTLPASATALEAAQSMAKNKVGAVLVTDDAGRARGIFTERDLMVRVIVAGKGPGLVRLEEVMTRDLFVASPDHKIAEMRTELQVRHIRHLPIVVEDGVAIAMLSLRDLLRADLDSCVIQVQALTEYIQSPLEPPPL